MASTPSKETQQTEEVEIDVYAAPHLPNMWIEASHKLLITSIGHESTYLVVGKYRKDGVITSLLNREDKAFAFRNGLNVSNNCKCE
jgi:hypothetical protein